MGDRARMSHYQLADFTMIDEENGVVEVDIETGIAGDAAPEETTEEVAPLEEVTVETTDESEDPTV